MPIQGISDYERVPRLGKFHLGIKVPNRDGKGVHPEATNYFVLPDNRPDLKELLGEKPTSLDIMLPSEDPGQFAQQWYRQYSNLRGKICQGDGITCTRLIDTETGDIANRDSKKLSWSDELECAGRNCLDYQAKKCKEVMNLQFLLPSVPGIGIWQIDTGSYYSIVNINSSITLIRKTFGRVAYIPLTLSLVAREVVDPDHHVKKNIYIFDLNTKLTLNQLAEAAKKERGRYLLTAPAPDDRPDDFDEDGTFPANTLNPGEIEGETVPAKTKEPTIQDTLDNADKVLASPPALPPKKQAAASVTPPPPVPHDIPVDKSDVPENSGEDLDDGDFVTPEQIVPESKAYQAATAKPPAPPRKVTPDQLDRIRFLKANYTIALAPYIRKVAKDATAIDQLTEEQAGQAIKEIEAYLKGKGVLR